MMLSFVIFCLISSMACQATVHKLRQTRDSSTFWSHGCRGIPGLEQSVNKLYCPTGCRIIIHQVTYTTKNTPGCPYEISHPVEPHCCQREETDDCHQNKDQKIPMLQLLCREAESVCELSVDRVVLRCPRNAFSISSQRSIRYGCSCAFTTITSPLSTSGGTVITSRPLNYSSILNTTPLLSSKRNSFWTRSTTSVRQPLTSTLPPITPMHSGSPRRRFIIVSYSTTGHSNVTRVADISKSTTTSLEKTTSKEVTQTTKPKGILTDKPTTTDTVGTEGPVTGERILNTDSPPIGDHFDEEQNQYQSDQNTPSTKKQNGIIVGGIIGGAGFIVTVGVIIAIFVCVRRRHHKSESQGTEEVSQYAYETMDIALRRPHPVSINGEEVTSLEAGDEYNDISLDNHADEGTFLEKQIQKYLITSIYAEIKDFKRRSQESSGKQSDKRTSVISNKSGCQTAIVKPIPKPRKISDLYSKVKKNVVKLNADSYAKREPVHTFSVDTEINHGPVKTQVVPYGSDEFYSLCDSSTLVVPDRGHCQDEKGNIIKDTYDTLGHGSDINKPRVASGPYDELYSSAEGTESVSSIKYFNNCEYSTLNVENGRVSLISSHSFSSTETK